MAQEVLRIGIYWYLDDNLKNLLEQTWRGDLNQYKACNLVARHCGDCLVWGGHSTCVDAISILLDEREDFINTMRGVVKQYLPIKLNNPQLKKWGHNVFIRWEEDSEWERFKEMRKKLMAEAKKFVIVEQVSWEAIDALEQTLKLMGSDADPKFFEGLNKLKNLVSQGPLKLIHAPNVPLDWYVRRLADGKEIKDGELPFPPIPHISVATAVRWDNKYEMSAEDVGDHICNELINVQRWSPLLGRAVTHIIESTHVVEPVPPSIPPLQVTVIDRISGKAKEESRNRWIAKEEIS